MSAPNWRLYNTEDRNQLDAYDRDMVIQLKWFKKCESNGQKYHHKLCFSTIAVGSSSISIGMRHIFGRFTAKERI